MKEGGAVGVPSAQAPRGRGAGGCFVVFIFIYSYQQDFIRGKIKQESVGHGVECL